MVSKKKVMEEIRARYLALIGEFLDGYGEEVLQIKSNEITIPVIGSDDNEYWLVCTVKVPTGADKGREPFDGYVEAEDYEHKLKEKELKAKKKAEEKAKKIEHDKKVRGEQK